MATTRSTLGRLRAGLLASAAIVALAIAGAPVKLSGDGLSLEASSALAKGGQGGDRSSDKGGNGNGNANGHGKQGDGLIAGDGPSGNHGALASALGRLNAYHASDQAKENALAKDNLSAVGAVAAYEEALEAYLADPADTDLLDDVAEALALAANKDLSAETIGAFNDALGQPTDEDQEDEIADTTQVIQDEETSQGLGGSD